jgi:hypothetical protein
VRDTSALEGILQPFHQREIIGAAVPPLSPPREIHGNVHGHIRRAAPMHTAIPTPIRILMFAGICLQANPKLSATRSTITDQRVCSMAWPR